MARSSARRNLAICGHASAGKTTLVDRLLAVSGVVSGTPDVIDKSSVCDFDEEEKAHGHTIESTLVHLEHEGTQFNLIDTPGYTDFIGSTIGAIAAVDCAVVCINAHTGIQLNARRAMKEAKKAGIARILVITKLDDAQADFSSILESCRELWGSVVPLQVPVGQGASLSSVMSTVALPTEARGVVLNLAHAHEQLVEKLVEADESLMEQYFEGVMPDTESLERLLKAGIASGSIIPVLCTSATQGVGLKELLSMLAHVAPGPEDIKRKAMDEEGNETVIDQSVDAPALAQVFKVRIDPFVQKLSYVRVFAGSLAKDQMIHASGVRKDVKLNPVLRVQGEHTEAIDVAESGDIVAIAKMEDLHVGSSLGDTSIAANSSSPSRWWDSRSRPPIEAMKTSCPRPCTN